MEAYTPIPLPAREAMTPAARKMRDFYDRKPGAPFYQREFGNYCLGPLVSGGAAQGCGSR